MYVYLLLTLLIPMLALKKRREGDASILDARSTTCIKGILCIYVMLHNLGLDVPTNTPMKELICEHAGGVGVGVFFFLSAFGIIRSYQAKGNKYLLRLIFVHIPKLWAVAVFINSITYLSFPERYPDVSGLDLWLRILNLDVFNNFRHINRHGWYIATIITLYLIFAAVYFICSKLKTDKKFIIAGIVMALVAIGLRIAAVVTDIGRMYAREIPTFAIGCIYATFYDEVNALAKRFFIPGMILSTAALIIGFLTVEAVATYAAAVIVILVSQKFTYYSPVAHFLGKICIGVYLFLHYSSIVLEAFLSQEYLWVLTNAGYILLVAVMIYAVQYAIDLAVMKLTNIIKTKRTRI